MEMERPKLKKKKKSRVREEEKLEEDFHNLSIDFPQSSFESINENLKTQIASDEAEKSTSESNDEELLKELKQYEEIENVQEHCDEASKCDTNVENCVPSAPDTEEIPPSTQIKFDVPAVHTKNNVFYQEALYPNLSDVAQTPAFQLSEKILSPVTIQPFTALQKEQLYSNGEIQLVEMFESEFVDRELNDPLKQDHPLYALLRRYAKARTNYLINTKNIDTMLKKLGKNYQSVWRIEKKTAGGHSFCSCGRVANATHVYNFAIFDEGVNCDMEKNLKELQRMSCFNHTKLSQECALVQRQIEQMIAELMNRKQFSNITKSSPVALNENLVYGDMKSAVIELRLYISILFKFYRESLHDKELTKSVQNWIKNLVALQLKVATWEDHIFILFQLLRCPVGIGNWAAELIQIPIFERSYEELLSPFTLPEFQHAIAVLSALLLPVKNRGSFLTEITKDLTPSNSKGDDDVWILVDSDGEEGSSSSGECIGLKENDIVAFFNQIPFETIFKMMTFLQSSDMSEVKVSGHHLIKTIAFASKFIEIFKRGLTTYDSERYKQFAKRLGKLMKHTLSFISDMIKIYIKSKNYPDPQEFHRIQVEFDELVIRSANFIYDSKKLALFQYLADFPYEHMSIKSLWKLYYFLFTGEFKDVENLEIPSDLRFNDDIATDDLYFLLHAFAHMGMAKGREDKEFVLFIVKDLLQIGFINDGTKDFCYNNVKDLLTNIASKYPELIAEIFNYLKGNLHQIGTLGSYLFKALPIFKWKPEASDLEMLASWLLNFDFDALENSTARVIFAYMNWGYDDKNELFLPQEIHIRMAYLVCEVYMKHINESIGTGIYETVKLQGTLKRALTKKEQFSSWCWSMISTLHLHEMDFNKITLEKNPMMLNLIPEVETTNIIYQGVTDQKPLAIYISLLMSQLGHSIPQICHRGFDQLKLLLNDHRHSKVIRCLELITPLFVRCQDSLYSCDNFMSILNTIFSADKTYSKVMRDVVITDGKGPILTLFNSMIQNQLTSYMKYGWQSPWEMISLWINCLIRVRDWNKDLGVLWVLDTVCEIAYLHADAWSWTREIMRPFVVRVADTKIPKSSGLLTLITSEEKDILISPIEEAPVLSLLILELEFENIEMNTYFWSEFLCQLKIQDKNQLSNVLKKTLTTKQLPQFPAQSLVIFKLAKLISNSSPKHFLFPIICQQFFSLYLSRVPTDLGNDFGVQDKFYDGDISLMKKLKKIFQDTEAYHSKMATEFTSDMLSMFHTNCAKLFKTYLLWLEENQLNKMTQQNIILPPIYDHPKLKQIFQGNRAYWTEYINLTELKKNHKMVCKNWQAVCMRQTEADASKFSRDAEEAKDESVEEIKEMILKRLKMYSAPLPPPEYNKPAPHIGTIDLSRSTLKLLRNESKIIQQFSHQFNMLVNEHKAIDAMYRDTVRHLYVNEPTYRMKTVSCSRIMDNCQGSATIKFEFSEMRTNEALRLKLEDNRGLQKKVVAKELKPPDMKVVDANFCLYNVIQQLLDRYENHSKRGEKEMCDQILKIVTEFFYEMLTDINEDLQQCPVTHELYSIAISKLGVLVQQNHNTEGINLLKLALQRPNLVNLIADLFTPSVSAPQYFLEMYKCLVDSYARKCSPQLLFVLFSKFDIPTWLKMHKPKLIEVSNLIQLIMRGLELWNFENSDLLQDLLRCHLVNLFMYRFPEQFGEILQSVLVEFSNQRIKSVILLDLLNALYQNAGCAKLDTDMSIGRMKDEMRNFASKQTLFQYNDVSSTALMLSHHFYNERLNHGLHGVYPKFSEYCDVVCLLFGTIGHCAVASAIQAYPGMSADQLVNWLWQCISDMFAPWLLPYYPQNMKDAPANWIQQFTSSNSVLQPWSEIHSENAGKVIRVFAMSLQYILDMLPVSNILIGHLFSWYDGYYAHKTTAKHVLIPVQTLLMKMPFERFRPFPSHMEGFNRILLDYTPDCHLFVGNIFLRISWTQWLQQNITSWDFTVAQRMLSILLGMLVKLSFEPKVRESIRILQLLQESLKYPWYLLEYKDIEGVLDWFVMSADPSIILKIPSEENSVDSSLLLLLQTATCMKEISKDDQNIQRSVLIAKRMVYVRSVVRLLKSCDAKLHQLISSKQGQEMFYQACVSLLHSIDTCYANSDESKTMEVVNLITTIMQTMTVPEGTANHFAEGIRLWQTTSQAGNMILCSFLNALSMQKHWTLAVFKIMEVTLANYMRISDLSPNHSPSWSDAYKRFSVNIPFDYKMLIDNDFFLTLHMLSYIKMLTLTDDSERVQYLQELQTKLAAKKTSEVTEPSVCMMWAFLIMSGGYIMKRSNTSKNQMLVIARYFQLNLNQTEGWGEGLLGAIGLKKESESNRKKILLRCFSCTIFAICSGPSNAVTMNEYDTSLNELKTQVNSKRFADLRMQGMQAIDMIENNRETMLDNITDTISKLIRIFYSEPYLCSIEYLYHW